MAIVFTSTASTGVATVTGSKVVVPIAVPDNCYSIVFQNDDATDTILVAQGTAVPFMFVRTHHSYGTAEQNRNVWMT